MKKVSEISATKEIKEVKSNPALTEVSYQVGDSFDYKGSIYTVVDIPSANSVHAKNINFPFDSEIIFTKGLN